VFVGISEEEAEDKACGPIPWQTSGHPHIGMRVMRRFGDEGTVAAGGITAWVPADEAEGDAALWHMVHDDGDEEDLEEHEVQEALETWKNRKGRKGKGKGKGEGEGAGATATATATAAAAAAAACLRPTATQCPASLRFPATCPTAQCPPSTPA
jgi:hypothetical protein